MNATSTTTAPPPTVPVPFPPGGAILESMHLAEVLALQASEAWLHAVEEGVTAEHNLLMALMGYRPQEHVAPWDSLGTSSGDAWLAALDKGLSAAGE